MGIRTRVIATTMSVAISTAVLGAATVSAAPASQPAPVSSDGKKPGVDDATLAKVAASLRVSVQQLTTALGNLKQATAKGVDKPAAVAAFAKELGVSVPQAEKALRELSGRDEKPNPGKDKPGVPEEAVKLLATELHISADRARQVWRDVAKVKVRGDAVVKDPAFVAIAKGLGITPQRLLDALVKVKKQLAKDNGKPKDEKPSGSPAK